MLATMTTSVQGKGRAAALPTEERRSTIVAATLPLFLDQEGWKEVVSIMEEATKLMLAAHVRSQDRLSDRAGEGAMSTVVGIAAFETAGSLAGT